jgi:hypothetical protein
MLQSISPVLGTTALQSDPSLMILHELCCADDNVCYDVSNMKFVGRMDRVHRRKRVELFISREEFIL